MRSQFQDLLAIDGVKGVVYFNPADRQVVQAFNADGSGAADAGDWLNLASSLGKAGEAELIFESGRLFVRQSPDGVLLVVMGLMAPTGMVRLTSDIVLSGLREPKPARGLRRFFRR